MLSSDESDNSYLLLSDLSSFEVMNTSIKAHLCDFVICQQELPKLQTFCIHYIYSSNQSVVRK